jgi:hypothetical protein
MDGTDGLTEIEGALSFGGGRGAEGSLTEMAGTSAGRLMTGALKLWPRVTEGASFTEMLGTACVVDTLLKRPRGGAVDGAGVSLTDIVGIGGVTPIAGILPDRLFFRDGVSLTEMVGMTDTDCGLPNRLLLAGRASLIAILGIGGWGRVDGGGSAYGSVGGSAYGSVTIGGLADLGGSA